MADGGADAHAPHVPAHARRRSRRSRRRGRALPVTVALLVVLALALAATTLQLVDHRHRSAHPRSQQAVATTAPAPTTAVRARPPVASPTPTTTTTTYPSPAPAASSPDVAARQAAVEAVLARHAAAFLHRDRGAWAATLDPAATAYRNAQLATFGNAAQVPFASYYYEVDRDDVAEATAPRPGELLVPVTLRYALRGFDPQPTALRLYLTFAVRQGGWLLAGDSDGVAEHETSAHDLWELGPVVAVRGARSLVLAHPDKAALARTLAATADAAVPRVNAFWGTAWAGRVVVLVPDSEAELRTIVGTSQDLSQIAALATAEIGTHAGSSGAVGDRVAINPGTFGVLGSLGRRVVMTHEITHVATRAVTGADSPTWLVEGIADYVGFKGTSTSLRFDAAELAHAVDTGHPPTRLPTAHDFASAGSHLSLDYEEAWLACRFIVSRTSEAALIRFYKAVGTATTSPSAAVRDAFASVLHTDQATFTRSWASYVTASLQ